MRTTPAVKDDNLPLARVLAEHRRACARAAELRPLDGCLGDGFLLLHNGAYRDMRKHALACGFRFTTRDEFHHRALPLLSLRAYLAKKKILYIDNVTPLEQLEAERPRSFSVFDVGFTLNQPLHEAAHAVAHTTLAPLFPAYDALPLAQSTIYRIFMEEAFAGTTEVLSSGLASTQLHRIFFGLNSYVYMPTQLSDELRASMPRFAPGPLAKLVFLSFFLSNLLFVNVSRATLGVVLREHCGFGRLTKEERDFLARLFQNGLDFSPRFRVKTNRAYLKLMGLRKDYFRVLDVEPLEVLRRPDVAAGMEALLERLRVA